MKTPVRLVRHLPNGTILQLSAPLLEIFFAYAPFLVKVKLGTSIVCSESTVFVTTWRENFSIITFMNERFFYRKLTFSSSVGSWWAGRSHWLFILYLLLIYHHYGRSYFWIRTSTFRFFESKSEFLSISSAMRDNIAR